MDFGEILRMEWMVTVVRKIWVTFRLIRILSGSE